MYDSIPMFFADVDKKSGGFGEPRTCKVALGGMRSVAVGGDGRYSRPPRVPGGRPGSHLPAISPLPRKSRCSSATDARVAAATAAAASTAAVATGIAAATTTIVVGARRLAHSASDLNMATAQGRLRVLDVSP